MDTTTHEPRTMARGRQREAARNFIPLRINTAGVMPIIFAQSIMFVPPTIATFFPSVPFMQTFASAFRFGSLLYILVFTVLIAVTLVLLAVMASLERRGRRRGDE